ncbi:hypothetical protein [Ekhidna sp.]
MKYRAVIPILLIIIGFISAIAILWDQEFKNYVPVGDNSDLAVNSKMDLDFLKEGRPSYLHFFSEECTNARVNINHINRIITKYGSHVNFYIVNSSSIDAVSLRNKYDIPSSVQIVNDATATLTKSLHVKSLPYALIANSEQRLFFGGNYNNQNGLCGSGEIIWSSPAVALKFLINQQQPPIFPSYQLNFVGCGV